MYSPKYSKAQSCAYFCSKNVLVALNSLYIVSTRISLLILGDYSESDFTLGVLNWQIEFSKAFVSLRGNQATEITHRCYPSTFQDLICDMREKGRIQLIVRTPMQVKGKFHVRKEIAVMIN